MKFRIVELEGISGSSASIYSIIIDGHQDTLYDYFLDENWDKNQEEVEDIEDALSTMGNYTGLIGNRIISAEGEKDDDGIIAFCNRPNKILRLYGFSPNDKIAIIGGGGPKPFFGRLQKSEKLKKENDLIKKVKKVLEAAELAGEITFSDERISSTTNFVYDSDNYLI